MRKSGNNSQMKFPIYSYNEYDDELEKNQKIINRELNENDREEHKITNFQNFKKI